MSSKPPFHAVPNTLSAKRQTRLLWGTRCALSHCVKLFLSKNFPSCTRLPLANTRSHASIAFDSSSSADERDGYARPVCSSAKKLFAKITSSTNSYQLSMMPLAALADRRVRGEFKAWRDSFAATPRKADYARTTLARIMSFAKDRGMITANPCEKSGRLYAADRSDKIWGETEIAALLAAASDEIKSALVLALWTGQRQGELLRLPWSSYDGTHVRFRQSK